MRSRMLQFVLGALFLTLGVWDWIATEPPFGLQGVFRLILGAAFAAVGVAIAVRAISAATVDITPPPG